MNISALVALLLMASLDQWDLGTIMLSYHSVPCWTFMLSHLTDGTPFDHQWPRPVNKPHRSYIQLFLLILGRLKSSQAPSHIQPIHILPTLPCIDPCPIWFIQRVPHPDQLHTNMQLSNFLVSSHTCLFNYPHTLSGMLLFGPYSSTSTCHHLPI